MSVWLILMQPFWLLVDCNIKNLTELNLHIVIELVYNGCSARSVCRRSCALLRRWSAGSMLRQSIPNLTFQPVFPISSDIFHQQPTEIGNLLVCMAAVVKVGYIVIERLLWYKHAWNVLALTTRPVFYFQRWLWNFYPNVKKKKKKNLCLVHSISLFILAIYMRPNPIELVGI